MHVGRECCHNKRWDWFEIIDENIMENACSIAFIITKTGMILKKEGYSTQIVKAYRRLLKLCDKEPYQDQPIAIFPHFTGFLVKSDIIATAGHCVTERNVTSLRIIFGYRMNSPFTPITEIADCNIYRGVKVIRGGDSCNGSDWALIKLDRPVAQQKVTRLSHKDVYPDQSIYTIGHPLGLPLKYSGDSKVLRMCDSKSFRTNLSVYSGSSGSPVFDSYTHEVIGLVVGGYDRYFKWMGDCWASIDYTDVAPEKGARCIKVKEFSSILE